MAHSDPNAKQPKRTWKVWYEGKAGYTGNFNPRIPLGLQGTFDIYEKAVEAGEACKTWFNTDSKIVQKPQRDGSVIDTIVEKIHDNVTVWIEELVDGLPVPEKETEICEISPKPQATEEEFEESLAEA